MKWCSAANAIDFLQYKDAIDNLDKRIAPLVRGAPIFPPKAARQRAEGLVIVEVDADLFGNPKAVKVVGGENRKLFEKAAVNAVKTWRLKPMCDDKGAIPQEKVMQQLTFKVGK